jgi:class 3 adenylate cyclase
MAMQQKVAAILAVEVTGGPPDAAGELGTVQYELVDPTISRFGGRIFALTRTRTLVEFAEAAPAVACALEIARGMSERNATRAAGRSLQLGLGIDAGEVVSASGDIAGTTVTVARALARVGREGAVAVSGKVARALERRRPQAEVARRTALTIEGVAEVELVELRPLARRKAQSPWILRRRWTWIAALAAIVLLAGASIVLWRPLREALLAAPPATEQRN